MLREVEPTLLDGVSVVSLSDPLEDHNQLVANIGSIGLNLQDLFPDAIENSRLRVHPRIKYRQDRAPTEPRRDPWTHDLMFHMDGAALHEDAQPIATLIVGRHIEPGAPPTTIVSMSKLLEIATEDGIFDDMDPRQIRAVFAESTYYAQAQPFFLDWFKSSQEPEAQAAAERLEHIMQRNYTRYPGVRSLEALVQKMDDDSPPREVDFVVPHTVTGEDALYFDGCVRNSGLKSGEIEQAKLDQLLKVLRWNYLGNLDMLRERDAAIQITPQTGKGVAFVQKGTLHRGEKGHDAARRTSVVAFLRDDI